MCDEPLAKSLTTCTMASRRKKQSSQAKVSVAPAAEPQSARAETPALPAELVTPAARQDRWDRSHKIVATLAGALGTVLGALGFFSSRQVAHDQQAQRVEIDCLATERTSLRPRKYDRRRLRLITAWGHAVGELHEPPPMVLC